MADTFHKNGNNSANIHPIDLDQNPEHSHWPGLSFQLSLYSVGLILTELLPFSWRVLARTSCIKKLYFAIVCLSWCTAYTLYRLILFAISHVMKYEYPYWEVIGKYLRQLCWSILEQSSRAEMRRGWAIIARENTIIAHVNNDGDNLWIFKANI